MTPQASACGSSEFIEFWVEKMQRLRKDSDGSLLFSKRNLDIHRKPVRPDLVKIQSTIHIPVSYSSRYEKYDREGRLVETYESPKEPPSKVEETPTRVDWFFKDHEDEPIITICERCLRNMKDFVKETHEKFH
jgi:hypothetical protein